MFFIVLSGKAMCQHMEQEANLKAAFIYNFTKYVEWDKTLPDVEFIIAVIGTSEMDKPLIELARNNLVAGKKILVKHFDKPEDITYCHILFIPQNSAFSLRSILERIDKNVLTISEHPGFGKQGAAFNFVVVNDKLKFEANLKALNSAGLKAGAQLLKLAIIVD